MAPAILEESQVSDVDQHESAPIAGGGEARAPRADEAPVELRCSVIIFRRGSVLLLHRRGADEWVLPGGRPRPGESLASCARREVREETGLSIVPGRCALVLEVAGPGRGPRVVELVFLAGPVLTHDELHGGEPGRVPTWMPLSDVASLSLRPPISGHLRSLLKDDRATAAYLGNVWRPAATGHTMDHGGADELARSDP